MKIFIIYILQLLFFISIILPQVKPYVEPNSFNNSQNIIHNSFIYDKNIINYQLNKNIQQTLITLKYYDFYRIKMFITNLNEQDLIYVINNKNRQEFIGPYSIKDIKNSYIVSDLIKTDEIIIEFNSNNIDTTKMMEIEIEQINFDYKYKNSNSYFTREREEPVIIVTGYWPPTNEMLRHFSQNQTLNPNGWEGDNWENSGYDIISFFPTFDDPECIDCGQGLGDFKVDYQDTSEDFWPIFNTINPIAIITFSRGFNNNSWELELNAYNRTNWYNDYASPFLPTPNPPDQNEDTFFLRNSNLPMNDIIDNINNNLSSLGLDVYIDEFGDPGHFVSEFMAYHGVWYRDLNITGDDKCIAAGHIHVGGLVEVNNAKIATEESLRTLIDYINQFIYTIGDVNQDNTIDILDLVIIMNNILGNNELTQIEFYASDMNEDGTINVQDIIIIINIILNNI